MEGFRSMLRHGLVVLVVVALASVGAATRPATVVADDSLTIEEMCGLFPTNMGLSIGAEGGVNCMGSRGTLMDRGKDVETWLTGSIWAEANAAEARAEMDGSGVPTSWTPVSGLGDIAFEIYLSEFNMYVLRDRYILYVQAATNLTDEAKRLMAHLDRELAAALAGDPVDSDVADGSGDEGGGDGDDQTIDYVGVFFGSTSMRKGLGAGMDAYAACETTGDCSGNVRAAALLENLYHTFMRDYENPSERDRLRVAALAAALGMSEIVGKDCKPLFPSIATALPVIERLAIYGAAFYQPAEGDPVPVAQRLIELLAAQDAAQWEDRFPQNHESIDWPPCGDIGGGSN